MKEVCVKNTYIIKQFFTLLLAAFLLVGLLPIKALAEGITSVSTETELVSVFQNGGEAVLVSDIILSAPLVVPLGKTVTLDLNGKTIDRGMTGKSATLTGNAVTVAGTLTLNDSQGTGVIKGGTKGVYTGGGGIYVNGGTFIMNGGGISGNTTSASGGGVFVESGSFEMNGGTISENTSTNGGGGVCVSAGASFTLSAGVISGNITSGDGGGIYANGGTFIMNGGTISGNTADGNEINKGFGGGVAVMFASSFSMHAGVISSNTAAGYSTMFGEGGGVFINMSGCFTMDGGKISGNKAYYGGGVHLNGSVYESGPVSSFTMSAGEISDNTTDKSSASGYGGGVYVASGSVTINGSSKINRNSAATGGGVYMLNGTCVMENSEISENTTFKSVENHGGSGVYLTAGTFIMNSGKINGNTGVRGGGIYVFGGTFTMKDGQINENTTCALDGQLCDGGGVYLDANGTFCMEGGEIRGNATSAWNMYNHGGGVFVYGGVFKVSGSISIIDNNRSGVPNNVYLKTDASEITVVGELTGADGAIGISTRTVPEGTTSLTVAQGVNYTIGDNDFNKFTRDTGGALSLGDNKIELPDPNTSYLTYLSYNANGGSGTHSSTAIVEGMDNNIAVASGADFSRTNCSFAGWNTKADGSGTPYQTEDILTLTTNTVLYAQWTIDKAELIVTVPNAGASPSTTALCSPTGVTTALAWKQGTTPVVGSFDYNTVYSVEMTLTAGSGCKFSSTPEVLINGQPASILSGSAAAQTITFTFSKTGPRNAPTANLSKTVINVANTGGATPLTLNLSGIVDGYNSLTWTMSETDGSNILTLPSTTTGTLVDGALSLGTFTVDANAAGQPAKSASVTISFSGNASGEYAGVPASATVTFQLAAGNAPDAVLDFINEKITGVSSDLEYLVDSSAGNPADWTGATAVTGTEISISGLIPAAGSSSKYIHIRLKNIVGSEPKNIEIPARPDLTKDLDWDSWVDHNIENSTELGCVPENYGYRINNGPNIINSTGSWLEILLKPCDKLTFWMRATTSNFKSAEITVTAPTRREKPAVAIDFTAEKLNTTTDMQYWDSAKNEWKDCDPNMAVTAFGWDGTKDVSVQFYHPYTESNYASEAQILTIPARPAAPVVNYTATATKITVAADEGVRYRLDGGEWKTADADGKVIFTGLTANQSYTVNAERFATVSSFGSVSSSSVSTGSLADGTGSVTMAGWTYGSTAAEPVPVSATNGTGSVTYTYSGTKADGTAYNSNTKPIDAGSYTVTATFAATSDYKQVISQPVSFTITKKEIEVQWKNLNVVYDGAPKSPTLTILGVESGDTADVSGQLSESKTNAGSYSVTAALSGSRALNYSLINPNNTLVIQKAPVTFCITADSVKHDGSGHTAAVTASSNGSVYSAFSVTYKNSNGEAVANPSNVGSYGIYAQITDANYRHADTADGTAMKIGILTVYAASAPDTYTVSFSGGDGAVGSVSTLTSVQAGTVRILPDSTGMTNGTKLFAGWKYGGMVYQPGESLSQPPSNITLTAIWTENSYSISGVVYQGVTPLPDTVVTLMRGSVQLGQTVTSAGGEYSFANSAPGRYNLVASKKGITQTVLVEIVQSGVTNQNIILPADKTNSVVEVAAGSPVIVVGNLEQAFSNADKQAAGNGSTVEMKLKAKALESSGADQAAIDAAAGNTVGLYLELNLTKTVTPVSGAPSTTAIIESNVLLEIVVQIPGELQGKDNYVVYRRHNGEVQTLTKTQNSNGEYITVNADKTAITIHAKLFSTYAVGYIAPVNPGNLGSSSSSSDYTITAIAGDGGSISPSGTVSVTQGSSKTFTVTPDNGYAISDVLVDDVSVGSVSSYTFSNITASHTIKAVFAKAAGLPYYLDGNNNKMFIGFCYEVNGTMKYIAPKGKTILFAPNPKSFTDIVDHWAKSGIDFVTQREIFQGTDTASFSPNTGMTRGMFAAVIGRLYERSYGMLTPEITATFTDVPTSAYYSTYVSWAAKNGIIEGVGGGKFAPDRQITREEMALLLYRFARFLKISEVEISEVKLSCPDALQISSWAIDAVKYCQETNLITGRSNGYFAPKETATRAEVATILERFIRAAVSKP